MSFIPVSISQQILRPGVIRLKTDIAETINKSLPLNAPTSHDNELRATALQSLLG